MKKLFKLWIPAFALAAALALTGCGSFAGKVSNKFDALTSTESVYGFSAASAGMLISAMSDENASVESGEVTPGGESGEVTPGVESGEVTPGGESGEVTPGGESGEVTPGNGQGGAGNGQGGVPEGLDKYMTLVESLLSDGAFSVSEEASDRKDYAYKLSFKYDDMQGNTFSYVLYYNETLIPDDDYDDDYDDDDETEEEYVIDGIMIIDGEEYPVHGEKQSESEGRENETETELRVTLGQGRFLIVEQSSEQDGDETEREFSYSIYENGKLCERSTFKYEQERDETELKLTSYRNGQKYEFGFERQAEHGRETIRLVTGDGNGRREYRVRPMTDAEGNVYYEYVEV